MVNFRFLIVIAVLVGTGCSGLFAEFPEFDGDDVGPSVEDDTSEPVEYDLTLEAEPPTQVTAGETFPVVFQLLDGLGNDLDMEGVELDLRVSEGEFSGGENQVSALSDEAGRVEFGLSIEVARSGLILTATSEHEDFSHVSVATDPFDVVAAQALAEFSSIEGVKNAVADGDEEAEIEIELFDEFENPLVGVIPEFEARGEEDEIEGGECSAINEEGVAKCTMTSMVAETKALSITHPITLVDGGVVEFSPFCVQSADFPDPFGGGNGEPNDPYLICTPAHLLDISDALGSSFLLTRNLNLQTFEFDVIGSNLEPFTGHFDGGGFIIRNLTIERSGSSYTGLFATIGEGASVENLALQNVNVEGNSLVGGLAGLNLGTITNVSVSEVTGKGNGARTGGLVGGNAATISGSRASGTIEGTTEVGGLVGENQGGATIEDSEAEVDVTGSGNHVGGLVGRNRGLISDSSAFGEINGTLRVGGLVGYSEGGSVITDSEAGGTVTGSGNKIGGLVGRSEGTTIERAFSYAAVIGVDRVGGLVGIVAGGSVTQGTAVGTVEGNDRVGGLVGWSNGPIASSQADGSVTGEIEVGGLVGYSEGEINNSSASGHVEGSGRIGGLVGFNRSGDINESYATGNVTATGSPVGGLIGRNRARVEDSYATGDVAGANDVGGLIGHNVEDQLNPITNSLNTVSFTYRSYATGNVTGGFKVGGLIGLNGGEIRQSYSLGDVISDVDATITSEYGGFVGRNTGSIGESYSAAEEVDSSNSPYGGFFGQNNGGIANSFWDTRSIGSDQGGSGVSGVETSHFENPDTFVDWDFTDVWEIGTTPEPDEELRPVFQWQVE